jgi:SAM-dependent methyltransferase
MLSMADDEAGVRNGVALASPDGCLLCGSHQGSIVWRENGYGARQCACGLLYATPPPRSPVDPREDLHLQSFYALPARMKAGWLRRRRPGGRLLEVGCGEGHFLKAARAEGYEVCAIEADPGRAGRVRDSLGVQVETALVEEATWPAGRCDIVFHCDLLSHFPDPLLALRRMGALLKPDGALCFEVGLVGGLPAYWHRFMGTLHMPAHRWFYTEAALAALLAAAGFKIDHISRFGLAPSFALARLGRWLGYGGGATRPVVGVARQENPARAWVHNFVRYRVGALVPGIGPQTALVLASRRSAGEA